MQKPFVPWTEYGDAKKVAMVTAPERGARVDIGERWSSLLAALGYLAHASKMGGLQNAIQTPRRKELKERYGDELPDIIANAEFAQRQSEVEARDAFRQAYGYRQMVDYTGDPLKTSEDFADDYDKFQDIYYGPKGNSAREKLKTKLQKNQVAAANDRYAKHTVRKMLSGEPPH
ncbi:hypothetical protein HY379_02455 [Candidatus Saccharibacteria bacterium]|nr:hypothetical protein [Candidatus Saccharibacteria bacterium]